MPCKCGRFSRFRDSTDDRVVVRDPLLKDLLASGLHLKDEIADPVPEQVLERDLFAEGDTESVSERHLGGCGSGSVAVHGISRLHFSFSHELGDALIDRADIRVYRDIILVSLDIDLDQFIARFLELRGDHIADLRHIYREGYQRRGNVNIVKCSGHTVLAADTADPEAQLRVVGAEKS